MVDFIRMGLIEVWGCESIVNYKMKKSCPQSDSNPVSSAYEANALHALISIDNLKVDSIIPECAIKTNLNCTEDEVKCFVVN